MHCIIYKLYLNKVGIFKAGAKGLWVDEINSTRLSCSVFKINEGVLDRAAEVTPFTATKGC